MDRQTLRDWVHRYNGEGVEGLKSRSSPGRAPALSEQQMAELRELVIDGSDPTIHKLMRSWTAMAPAGISGATSWWSRTISPCSPCHPTHPS